jgi:hypothetical protein
MTLLLLLWLAIREQTLLKPHLLELASRFSNHSKADPFVFLFQPD